MAFNKPNINKYFGFLKEAPKEINIWNVDESGFSTVPNTNNKILAARGRKQVGILASADRGKHFTVVCTINAAGMYLPPAIIFPKKRTKKELVDSAPSGIHVKDVPENENGDGKSSGQVMENMFSPPRDSPSSDSQLTVAQISPVPVNNISSKAKKLSKESRKKKSMHYVVNRSKRGVVRKLLPDISENDGDFSLDEEEDACIYCN
ncbi:hypothetical protein ILUMI_19894 [Ignelater luminosus]|uniref:Uncharacterized protein n=1 Tax=Ignelater luminosus TaxID=2038154 RepID=A0A8K0CHC3_IGNLU|nr:hypothetical protein ILUMI_19894 [Ignelater luminosus]